MTGASRVCEGAGRRASLHVDQRLLPRPFFCSDAKELHNPIELIVVEHDALAGRLGRRFADGDGK